MINLKSLLLILSSGGMVITCFYACTSLIFASLSQKPISVSEATMIFLLAILITYTHNQRGWRRISIIGLHISGLLFASIQLCHRYYELELPFWHFGWISELLIDERIAAEWPILILILLSVWILWFCGIRMVTRPVDATTISDRFDFGLGYLLFLLLIKLVIAVKGASIPVEHSSIKPIISYIILGLFAMGLVRTRSSMQTGGVIYFRGLGIALTFAFITLMLGGGLFILFLSELQTLSKAGANLFKTMIKPIEQILIALSQISLKGGIPRLFVSEPTVPVINRSGGEFGVLHYLFIGITITILLMMVGIVSYYLLKWFYAKIRWLFSETVEEKDNKGLWELLLSCFLAAMRIPSILWATFFHHPTSSTAEKFYRRLLRWGQFSGLRHVATETPKEYGMRLEERFPRINKEIKLIILLHDETVYGCIPTDGHQISRARLALRRIRHPFLWFARIKSLCFHDRF